MALDRSIKLHRLVRGREGAKFCKAYVVLYISLTLCKPMIFVYIGFLEDIESILKMVFSWNSFEKLCVSTIKWTILKWNSTVHCTMKFKRKRFQMSLMLLVTILFRLGCFLLSECFRDCDINWDCKIPFILHQNWRKFPVKLTTANLLESHN